jgi:hypothetical protein
MLINCYIILNIVSNTYLNNKRKEITSERGYERWSVIRGRAKEPIRDRGRAREERAGGRRETERKRERERERERAGGNSFINIHYKIYKP